MKLIASAHYCLYEEIILNTHKPRVGDQVTLLAALLLPGWCVEKKEEEAAVVGCWSSRAIAIIEVIDLHNRPLPYRERQLPC